MTLPFCQSGKVAGLKPDPKRSFFLPHLVKNFYSFCSDLLILFLFPRILFGPERLILQWRRLKFFEFADERFCQAQMPLLRPMYRIIVMCVTNDTAPNWHAARRVKRKVSAAGSRVQRTKITSAGRKTASASKTGAKPIPAI
jgi:hypothetical protein